MPLLTLTIIVAAGSLAFKAFDGLRAMPVTRVAVSGELRWVSEQMIAAEVQPFLAAGFVSLDIDGIREQLLQQPWIDEVQVSRRWPDEISIEVVEQKPIAKWGKLSYLNHRGNLFTPAKSQLKAQYFTTLPLLYGPEPRRDQVINYFRQLRSSLLDEQLNLQQLTVDGSGSWLAVLDNQVVLSLGEGEVMVKIRRFIRAYQQLLAKDFSRVKSVDLRYNNGFSVAWMPTAQAVASRQKS